MSIEIARSLYESARAHALSCNLLYVAALNRAVEEDHPDPDRFVFNGTYSLSIHFLMALGLEMYLKAAYVYHSGAESTKQLKKIGHDLVAALDATEQHGFHSIAPNLRQIVEILREPLLGEYFRYNIPTQMPLPSVAEVIGTIQVLDDELEPLLFPQ
jgi:hypothetical protein